MDRICNKMILDGIIDNSQNKKPPQMDNEFYGKTYFSKLILTPDYFDSLVDEETFKLFQNFSSSFFDNSKTKSIRGLILDKMIIFFFENALFIKLIFHGKEGIEQLIINFNETLGKKAFNEINLLKIKIINITSLKIGYYISRALMILKN